MPLTQAGAGFLKPNLDAAESLNGMHSTGNKSAKNLMALLMAANAILIMLGALKVYTTGGPIDDLSFNIGTERGYAGVFLYGEEMLVVFLLALLAFRSLAYLPWLLLFCYILVDDMFRLHETWGVRLAEMYGIAGVLGLRARDIGELAFVAFFTLLLGALVLYAYLRLRDEESREFYRRMTVVAAALGFFGVFVDMFDIIFDYRIFHLVEDGGEMIVISLLLWFLARWTSPRLQLPERGRVEARS